MQVKLAVITNIFKKRETNMAFFNPYNPSGTCSRCKAENVELWYQVCRVCSDKDEFDEPEENNENKTCINSNTL